MTVMLLEWSFTSAFLILVVLALRAALGKRIGAGLRYALWAAVLVRLLVPVQLFTSPVAGTWVVAEKRMEQTVYTAPNPPANPAGDIAGLPVAGGAAGAVPSVPKAPALPSAPEPPAAPDMTRLVPWLGWVWLAGSVAAALVLLASNLRFWRRLRQSRIPLEGADCPLPVYVAVGLPSPCLFGRSVYVTPQAAADPAMLRHVLAHEYTHFKHGDHLWSALRCAALAAHWWNPLVWLAAGLSRRDAELACDEGALKRLGEAERADYGRTLLALVTAKPAPADLLRCATTMAGDKKSLRERITRIAKAPRRWLWAAVAVVLATALACACAFGQAEPEVENGPAIVSAAGSRTELTFSLAEVGLSMEPVVQMKGTVEGFVLEEGAEWLPPADQPPLGQVRLRIPQEGCYAVLHARAGWKDGSRTAVEVSVEHFGSKGGSAFVTTVEFTAARSEAGWTVTDMEGQLPRLSDDRPKREITDQEAVLLARVASRLLTAAEDYYNGRTGDSYNGMAADLSLTLDDSGCVSVKGTVDGLDLGEGTYWQPDGAPAKTLTLRYPPFSDGVEGILYAYWEDGSREQVTINTDMMAAASSYSASGYWIFTVDLSGEEAAVTRMHAQTGTFPEGTQVRMYPESISDEEAVRAARIAAKLLTAAEDYYNSLGEKAAPEVEIAFAHGGNNPAMSFTVPEYALDAVRADVAEKFQAYAPGGVRSDGGSAYNEETRRWEPVPLENPVAFDRVRINQMQGPWTSTVLGMDIEVWRINYEFHTTTPGAAENLIVGGNYLTEDGWLCPTYSSCTYEIFLLDEEGGRSFALSQMQNSASPVDGADHFYETVARTLADQRLTDPSRLTPDLNRNGVPEELRLTSIDGGMGQKLEIYENGGLIFSEEGYNAHAGYNALFLYQDETGDYLLRYNPYMGQGWCDYSYQLFTLEHGKENLIREGAVSFDINFQPELHQSFDVNDICDFMGAVNSLLDHSVQLLNTDQDLLDAFDRLGRLEDDLEWLGWWEPAYVRGGQGYWSLAEELRIFQAAMEAQQYAEAPEVFPVDENGTDIRLSYRDKTARFAGEWDYRFQPAEAAVPQVLDLNGDGRDEIVVILTAGHGTGTLEQNLYVFDADTLEQYDASGLTAMILDQIQSTGDGENFYLKGLGLDEAIPKSGAENGGVPLAEALVVGDYVCYSIKDGRVFCWLGCDASGTLTNYTGWISVPVEMDAGGGFSPGEAAYAAEDGPGPLF